MELLLRSATLEDFDAVNAIIREGQEEHAEALPDRFTRLDHVVAMGWYRSFSAKTDKEIIVAVLDSEVIGVAMLEMKQSPNYDALVPRQYAYVNELAVASTHQRQGVGKKLYEAATQWARAREAASLELNVWEFNERAMQFYASVGMQTLNRTLTSNLKD
ncbi:GNAT family N-acetyltransferase [Paenibacillus qinlingensis]|uniref:GNAT superfamily N-acetyltransferase n=1 Tax=Paenibacillus qinlingensis TaxID=1837343 RepID=A0ABU1NQE3_9BACL|nr:GNAT family N-acetyltransferase [Paenibacillus qinlingensis]MDR6549643.1 GNAT superfamily N-acetyltransferase [Paenibacillus qinlingensis]